MKTKMSVWVNVVARNDVQRAGGIRMGRGIVRRLCLVMALAFAVYGQAGGMSAAENAGASTSASLVIPAQTGYSVPNPNGIQISSRNGVTRWSTPSERLVWYGLIRQVGEVEAALEWVARDGRAGRFKMHVGDQVRECSAEAKGTNLVRATLGRFSLSQTGYQRFELEWVPAVGEKDLPVQLKHLVLSGPAIERAHFNLKPRRNAASVHWGYPVGAGTNVMAFYAEVEAVEDPVLTYYMACGWHRGYFGMQVNSETERRIIFSVWDSGGEAVDRKKVDATNRVVLMGKTEGVFTGDFGNEGTGGHSHLKYGWKTRQVQKFLVTCQPTNQTYSVYSGYYWHPDKASWMLISSWKAPKEGGYLKGLYSFSENFGGENGHLLRKARFGRQWICHKEGTWMELTRARFTHDATGKSDRLDRYGGVEDGAFFLSHGGFLPGFTASGTLMDRPGTGDWPESLKVAVRDIPELRGTIAPGR